MEEVRHSIKVFVYHYAEGMVEYLLLRSKPRRESFWASILVG